MMKNNQKIDWFDVGEELKEFESLVDMYRDMLPQYLNYKAIKMYVTDPLRDRLEAGEKSDKLYQLIMGLRKNFLE